MPGDQLFPAFVVDHLPAGLAGLVIAGILAAAMGTHSSAINSLASSATHDLYASWTGRTRPGAPAPGRPADLRRLGASDSIGGRSVLSRRGRRQRHAGRGARALDRLGHLRRRCSAPISSPAAGRAPAGATWSARWRSRWRDAGGGLRQAARRGPGLAWLEPVGRLAWPWYVPLGTPARRRHGSRAQLSSGSTRLPPLTSERT